MGKQASSDGLGHKLRKVRTGGGLGSGFGTSWVPTFGKLRKSVSSGNEVPKKSELDDDIWHVPECRLTPDMLPKPLPIDCPPTSPRELLHSARSNVGNRQAIDSRCRDGDERDPHEMASFEVYEGGESAATVTKEHSERRRLTLDSIWETSDGESVSSDDGKLYPEAAPCTSVLGFCGREASQDTYTRSTPPDPARECSRRRSLAALPCRQKVNLDILSVPRGQRAALMMSEPTSDHWSDKGEECLSDVPSTTADPRGWPGHDMVALADDHRCDVFCDASISDGADDSALQSVQDAVQIQDDEFSFPQTVGFVADEVVQEFEGAWGHWGYSSEEACGSQGSEELNDDEDSFCEEELAVVVEETLNGDEESVHDSEEEEECPYVGGRDDSVYDDGAFYSLEKGDEVYYVQKLGEADHTYEGSGHSYEADAEGMRASVCLQGNCRPPMEILEEEFDEAEDAGPTSACAEYEQNMVPEECEAGVRQAVTGNVEVGPVTFYMGEEDIDRWGVGLQELDDTEGARDRSRESFGSADCPGIVDTALEYRNSSTATHTEYSQVGQEGNNVRACLYDTANTITSDRDQGLGLSWETSQMGYLETTTSSATGPSYSFSCGHKRRSHAPEKSWATSRYTSAESWRPIPFRRGAADLHTERCPTPTGILGNFFRRISEKLHLRPPAARVPVSTTANSPSSEGKTFTKQRNRYLKRQASMLKFVEERLENSERQHSGGRADHKGARSNRRNRASVAGIHDSAVDLTGYEAESAAVKSSFVRGLPNRSGNKGNVGSVDEPVACFGAGRRSVARRRLSGNSRKSINHNPVGRQDSVCASPV